MERIGRWGSKNVITMMYIFVVKIKEIYHREVCAFFSYFLSSYPYMLYIYLLNYSFLKIYVLNTKAGICKLKILYY